MVTLLIHFLINTAIHPLFYRCSNTVIHPSCNYSVKQERNKTTNQPVICWEQCPIKPISNSTNYPCKNIQN